MLLWLHTENAELRKMYDQHMQNAKIYSDSGVDLFVPTTYILHPHQVTIIPFDIQGQMYRKGTLSAYWLIPRSSISKTPLRMANNIGLIDSTYLGEIMMAVDNISDEPYVLEKGTRIAQLCAPNLKPIHVSFTEKELTNQGTRQKGGMGSTGL